MGQSDIFKLLLIILLLTNNKEGCDSGCGGISNINQIIIIMLLLNPPSDGLFSDNEDTIINNINTGATF